MKHFNDFIMERYVTALNDDIKTREKYADLVYKMLYDAYQYIGGLIGGDTFENFKLRYLYSDKISMWKLVRRGDKITACRIYKGNKGGRKSVCFACDKTIEGKRDLIMLMKEDYKITDRNTWEETSGKAFNAALKLGALVYPSYVALELLPDDDLEPMKDGYFYRRKIKAENGKVNICTKVIVGYPPKGEGVSLDEQLKTALKELSKKYEEEDDKINGSN